MFDAEVRIKISMIQGEAGDELKVTPVIPSEIMGLSADLQVQAIEACIRALSRAGLHIMKENGMAPKSL